MAWLHGRAGMAGCMVELAWLHSSWQHGMLEQTVSDLISVHSQAMIKHHLNLAVL